MKARALTRGEIKRLKKEGFSVFDMIDGKQTDEEAFRFLDYVAEDILKCPDDTPMNESLTIALECIKLTFGIDDTSVKNSEPLANGNGAKAGGTVKSIAKNTTKK